MLAGVSTTGPFLGSFLLGANLSISALASSRGQVQQHMVQDSFLRLGEKKSISLP